ncbi:Metallo-dependent hydrolase [Hortaea werneckii]|uniref:Amidohydrolase-related domain-containing protein n=2 Tax=Hortaea werneckii TaxID=91943 RepID=A0A3M7HDS1_HORWE|nr:Metallo-dependent hydrolase [Hortaea werneckii]OTA31332.1 hypothetical protein BTJ68_08343 [Hortaea werneckii EXF-2000]KAI6833810.1 Metallo-dependent hydrolase [Hortaea werneckii]KAI6929338.1 Metallo-dependent hydrolase [Hortaea werneckii]KAI6934834.1 Metallo-dependent hydrolase [Hortaea werneckii]
MKAATLFGGLLSAAVAHGSDIFYQGGTVISFNRNTSNLDILREADLHISGDRISGIYGANETITPPSNATVVNATGMIISPGFIDSHHHLWQTAYKTLASNTSLAEYFQRYGEYGPAVQNFHAEDTYLGQLTGCLELLHEGTTTVLDHAHGDFSDETTDAAVDATFECGVRAYYAHAIHPLPNNYTWEMQTNKLRSLAQDERFNSTGLVQLGLAYDFFSNAPAANVTELWNITRDNNLSVITTHFLGGPWGDVNSPVRFHEYDMLNHSTPVVFSHASFLTKEDANLLRETDQYICTTAESEFHYGHDHPHAHNIQDQAALGIDTHFTYSSSMVTQARLWLQSLRAPQYLEVLEDWEIPRNNPMSVYQAFHLITRAGALALRRDDIGIIAPGAKADIVTFRGDTPNMLGWEDPVAAVILHSNTGDIEDVLVNGQYVKRGGKLMYGDYASLSRRFLESSKRIKSIWNNMDWPRLEGIFNNISPYADADVIDTQRGDGSGYYAQSGALQR